MTLKHSSGRTLQDGFTLIELMITVAIVAIIASVAYPAYTDQIRKGRRAQCRSGLLQSLQQQERYYTQFNTYVTFTTGATTAKTKSFSGDSLANSACTIAATTCAAVGGVTPGINQCVEVAATMVTSGDPVSLLYMDSNGNKGCTYNGTARTTGQTACWP